MQSPHEQQCALTQAKFQMLDRENSKQAVEVWPTTAAPSEKMILLGSCCCVCSGFVCRHVAFFKHTDHLDEAYCCILKSTYRSATNGRGTR